jgi:hypothetical protein
MSKLTLAFLMFASLSVYDPQASVALLGPLGPSVVAIGETLKNAVNVNHVMPGLRFGRG